MSRSNDFLETILRRARARVATLRQGGPAAGRSVRAEVRPGRFRAALAGGEALRLIAEVKRASPSRGAFAPGLDAAQLARAYRRGGAAARSVLTEQELLRGSPEDLRRAADASGLPVLRKDFLVDPLQVGESARMGADAILLIARILPDRSLEDMLQAAREEAVDALVEVHDEAELERALAAGADLVGVNRRDLRTFVVRPERAFALAPLFPSSVVRVAESGVATAAEARRLGDAGYHAILVGEHLAGAEDPAAAAAELLR